MVLKSLTLERARFIMQTDLQHRQKKQQHWVSCSVLDLVRVLGETGLHCFAPSACPPGHGPVQPALCVQTPELVDLPLG